MLNVIVCEDSNVQREKLTNIIKDIIVKKNLDMKISLSTGEVAEVLDYIRNQPYTGIYFLDIDLKSNINGIKLGEMIKDTDPNSFIIFVTTHSELTLLTFEYKVEALDFIIKDNYKNIEDRIDKCIAKVLKRYKAINKDEKELIMNIDDRIIRLKYDDIMFIETSENIHKVRIHEKNRQLEFYSSLKGIEEALDERFIRCHRSFIVNRNNIKEISKQDRVIQMVNGDQCAISIRYLKNLIRL